MVSNAAASAEFVKRMREGGDNSALYPVSVTDAQQLMQRIGEQNARGLAVAQVMPNPALAGTGLVKELGRLVQASGDKEAKVTFTSVEGYLMAKTLVEGLRRAGRNPTRASLIAALESVREWDAGGVTVDFRGPRHEGVRLVELSMLGRGGRLFQ